MINIQLHPDCPYCKEHIAYHCETPEQFRKCRWLRKRRENIQKQRDEVRAAFEQELAELDDIIARLDKFMNFD